MCVCVHIINLFPLVANTCSAFPCLTTPATTCEAVRNPSFFEIRGSILEMLVPVYIRFRHSSSSSLAFSRSALTRFLLTTLSAAVNPSLHLGLYPVGLRAAKIV